MSFASSGEEGGCEIVRNNALCPPVPGTELQNPLYFLSGGVPGESFFPIFGLDLADTQSS
jgi:hypothetical protein